MRDADDNPPRLFEAEDAPHELRAWLAQARNDVTSSAEAQQLALAVQARFATPELRWPRLRSGLQRPGKVLVGLVAIGLGLGGWYVLHEDGRPDMANDSAMRTVSSGRALQETQSPSVPPTPTPAPVFNARPTDEEPTPLSVARAPHSHLAHARHNERDTVDHSSVSLHPGPAPTSSRDDEFALLRAARQAVGDHPNHALALTEEHARRFPIGMLAQERETIAIEALARLGRAAQAQARSRALLAAHPDSPYKGRIDAALSRLPSPQQVP